MDANDFQAYGKAADTKLPVELKKRDILFAVSQNQVTLVQAETGSGKSTKIPEILRDQYSRVIVTLPGKMAVV